MSEEEKRMEGMFSHAQGWPGHDRLGEELAARKAQLVSDYEANGVPKPEFTTLDTASV